MSEISVVVGDVVGLGVSTTRELLEEITAAGGVLEWAHVLVGELQESGDVVSGGAGAVAADARRWLGQVIADGELAASVLAGAGPPRRSRGLSVVPATSATRQRS